MEMRDTSSSNIAQVGYDTAEKVLRIVFQTGAIYDYTNVDELTYRQLLQSPSVGKFFHRYIKGSFDFNRIK